MLTTVYLSGEIGRKFGRKHKLAVTTPAEALRAIEANRPGFVAYLVAAGDRGTNFRVKVGGEAINERQLHFQKPGKTIRIAPVVAGSKSGVGQVIAGIALVAVAFISQQYELLPYAWGGVGTSAWAAAGQFIGALGISMAVGGVSQMLSPTPKGPQLSEGKPSYYFNGPVNTVEQGGPVPLAYGQVLVGSRIASAGIHGDDIGAAIAAPSVDNDGEGSFTTDPDYPTTEGSTPATNLRGRSLQTRQILRQLHILSDGEVAGICDPDGNVLNYDERNKGIYLDETPVQNADGTFALKEVTTAFRAGLASQGYLAGFPSAEAEVSVNTQVQKLGDKWANSVQRTVPAGSHNAIRVTVRFPALYEIDNKGNRTGSAVHFGIQIKRSAETDWREVVGGNLLPNGELDGLIQGEATEPYFRSFRIPLYGVGPWDVRVGRESADSSDPTKIQNDLYWHSYTKITDYKIAYRHSAILGVEYSAERFSSAAAVAVRLKGIKVKIPSNYNPVTRSYTGAWDGEFAGAAITLTSDYTAGDGTLAVSALAAALPINSPIEITVGSTVLRAYLLAAAIVGATSLSITPINQNISNGATGRGFEVKWTNNPAWIYYDISTHPRYGLGQYMTDSALDRWALYEISRYCDGVDGSGNFVGVDTGKGDSSVEPRFTFNTYIQSTAEAYQVLADLSSCFRGMVYWGNGYITAVQDAPKIPRFNFTDANVIDGAFNFSSTAAKARHTVAFVQWNDPDDFYSAKFEEVPDDDGVDELGVRPITIVAFGCTSRGQAKRTGLWKLLTERLENDTVTFRTEIEGARCRPGDICRISARFKTTNRMYGRLAAVGSGTVTLDSPVTLGAGTWTLYVAKQDGTEVELTITDPAGTYTTLNVTGDLTGVVANAVFILRSNTIEPALYRILNVKELEQRRFEITALLYNESKFGAIESGLAIVTPPTSDFPPTDPPVAPASVTIDETFVDTASGTQRFLTVSWEPSASWWTKDYVVEYREPNGEWKLLEATSNLSCEPLLVTALGDHSFRVYARSQLGNLSSSAAQDTYTLAEVTDPDAPTGLGILAQGHGFFLYWDNPDNPNLTVIEIQESLDGTFTNPPVAPSPVIGTAVAERGLIGAFHRGGVTTDFHRWYRVRARNKSGGKSGWTAAVDASATDNAKLVVLLADSQTFQIPKSGSVTPSSINLEAVGQNLTGSPTFTVETGTATLTGTGTTRNLAYADMATDAVVIKVAWDGQEDYISIVKVREGADSVVAFLTNEAHNVPADVSGNVTSWSGALTDMKVFIGLTDDTANWTFSKSESNLSGSFGTGGTANRYTATSMSADIGYVDLTASKTGYTSITKRFTVTKSKTGATGATGATGSTGATGPGIVSMGDYSSSQVYYQTSTRRDVVKSGGQYYITNNAAKSGTATWGTPGSSGDWDGPYSSYRFVATALLLAEDATITKTLVMGDGATASGGIIRSAGATAFGTGTGFWMNPRNGSNKTEFRVGDPSASYFSFDGTNLIAALGGTGTKFQIDIDPTFVGPNPPARLQFGTMKATADGSSVTTLDFTNGVMGVSHGQKFHIGNLTFGVSYTYGIETTNGEARFKKVRSEDGYFDSSGNQVVGARKSAVTAAPNNANESMLASDWAGSDTISLSALNTHLNAVDAFMNTLGNRINDLRDRLRVTGGHGLISD